MVPISALPAQYSEQCVQLVGCVPLKRCCHMAVQVHGHIEPRMAEDLHREAAAKMNAILAGADPALVTQTQARVN